MGGASPSRPLVVALALAAVGAVAVGAVRHRSGQSSSSFSGASVSRAMEGDAVPTDVVLSPSPPEPAEEAEAGLGAYEEDPVRREWACALTLAASNGDAAEVRRLIVSLPAGETLKSLINIQAEVPPRWPNVTAACAAALNGHSEALEVLLSAGADPNARCQKESSWDGAFMLMENDTALVVASKEGHVRCVELLLAAGANPNIECTSEYMEGAVEWGEEDDGTETMHYSALDVAAMNKRVEIIEMIQRSGGKPVLRKPAPPRRKMVSSGNRMGA
eukprot:NODE_17356_length_947_cov_6.940244.p1 GENE.NODE_17356_length_947_cov_6.940244~~NODE_17356_length_947_cov_6.940244.p1  ORF type:complete len:275 (-),score=81.70 NODE_17356_length_947_cov_6.940244:66-890(-)